MQRKARAQMEKEFKDQVYEDRTGKKKPEMQKIPKKFPKSILL